MMILKGVGAVGAVLALLAVSATASAEDLVFDLKNHSSFDVTEFYASPTGVDDWEDDVLGQDVLAAGDDVEITIGDGRTQCRYDLKFVFDDGDEVERKKVDLCETGSYTLRD